MGKTCQFSPNWSYEVCRIAIPFSSRAPSGRFVVDRFSGRIVENGHTGTVLEHESVAERGVSEGIGVGVRKDIAAVFEILMWQTKLSEQCGGHVALVH